MSDLDRAAALDALDAVYRNVTAVARRLGEVDLMRPSRCAGWAVADVLYYELLDARRALRTFASPADGPPDCDDVSYWTDYAPGGDGASGGGVSGGGVSGEDVSGGGVSGGGVSGDGVSGGGVSGEDVSGGGVSGGGAPGEGVSGGGVSGDGVSGGDASGEGASGGAAATYAEGSAAHARHVRIAASAYPPGVLAREWSETAAAAVRAGRACPHPAVMTQGHVLTVAGFAATLAVEAAVHYLDLTVALPGTPAPEPLSLALVRRVLTGLLGSPLPAAWDDVTAALKGTGRDLLTEADRQALGSSASKFPLFA